MDTVTTSVNNSVNESSKARGAADCDVAVVGAGPYGLSAGAHLKAQGLNIRVFGEPMEFWADKMPAGMLLRSPRVASNLSDPKSAYTLDAFEAATGAKPAAPVPLETFVEYGRWFRKQLGTCVDQNMVSAVTRDGSRFRLKVQGGEVLTSRKVVVAAGIGPFRSIPQVFADLSPAHVSHCYEGRKISEFRGKRVVVIGAGQSALESAALLHEGGAEVEIIARIPQLRWIGQHPWLHKLGPISKMLYSKHDIGPAGISRLVGMPNLVRHIPLETRDKLRKRAVRSAGSAWLPPRLKAVKTSTQRYVQLAQPKGDEVQLTLDDGSQRRVHHVLLGTGYQVDVSRYPFLAPDVIRDIRQMDGYPELGRGFSTSVPGLHFIGAAAARSFGPLLYFVTGTEFASKELTGHILRH